MLCGAPRIQIAHPSRLGMKRCQNYVPNSSPTSDFSSFSSLTLASILPRLNSLIGTLCTTCGLPSFTLTGNEQIKPFSTPYSPVEHNATLCQSSLGVPVIIE